MNQARNIEGYCSQRFDLGVVRIEGDILSSLSNRDIRGESVSCDTLYYDYISSGFLCQTAAIEEIA